jgi:hypothetical protein
MGEIQIGALDVAQILGYGITGLAFLLALFAYLLLRSEQKKRSPNQKIINAIFVFEIFAICLAIIGLSYEVFRWSHDQANANLQDQLKRTNGELDSAKSTIEGLNSKSEEYQQLKTEAADTKRKLAEAESEETSLHKKIDTLMGRKQPWLKITTIEGLSGYPLRIFIIANDVSYSYPVDTIWVQTDDTEPLPEIRFPVAVNSEDYTLRFFILAQEQYKEIRFESSQVIRHDATWEGKDSYKAFRISGVTRDVKSISEPRRDIHIVSRGSLATINYEIERQ